jgi:hypothetical protein
MGLFVTLSIIAEYCYAECCYAEFRVLFAIMPYHHAGCRYAECRSILERPAKDKHSSLIQKFVNYGLKKFYNIGPRALGER